MKKARAAALAVAVTGVMSATPSSAFVIGGSNLSVLGYPDPTCTEPMPRPVKPFEFTSEWEVDAYNSDVDAYNSQLRGYLDCVQEYVDNAKADIERIKEKANDLINRANTL